MGLRDLERRIERGVEGAIGWVFRSGMTDIELKKRLERELDAGRRTGRLGTPALPNDIEVSVNPRDAERLGVDSGLLERDLIQHARSHARSRECAFDGPLVVRIASDADVPIGTVDVRAAIRIEIDGSPPGSLTSPDGRIDLASFGSSPISIGRDVSADVVISDDDQVSRVHARLRATARGWVLEDLDSTNGTRVNGFRTTSQLLSDGDQIGIGATTFGFQAS